MGAAVVSKNEWLVEGTIAKSADDRSARRRRDILDAAFRLVAEKGLEGLRTRDVADRAGVNISTLFYYFGSKDMLLVALAGHVREVFSAPVEGAAAYTDLRSHLENTWKRFEANPSLATALQELMLRATRDEAVRSALTRVLEHWNKVVADLIRAEIDNGGLAATLDASQAAALVTSFVMGATLRLKVHPKAFSFNNVAKLLEARLRGSH